MHGQSSCPTVDAVDEQREELRPGPGPGPEHAPADAAAPNAWACGGAGIAKAVNATAFSTPRLCALRQPVRRVYDNPAMLELDDRLRILLVCDSLDIGGAERHVVNLAIALRKREHSVTIACSSEGVLAAQVRAVGIEVRPLLDGIVKRRLDRRYTSSLRQLIVQTSPDIVHAHLHASIVAASCAIEGTAPSFVITEHSEAIWRDSAAWS